MTVGTVRKISFGSVPFSVFVHMARDLLALGRVQHVRVGMWIPKQWNSRVTRNSTATKLPDCRTISPPSVIFFFVIVGKLFFKIVFINNFRHGDLLHMPAGTPSLKTRALCV